MLNILINVVRGSITGRYDKPENNLPIPQKGVYLDRSDHAQNGEVENSCDIAEISHWSVSVIFVSLVTSCYGLQEEVRTAHPMSPTWAFHIATRELKGR